MAAPQLGKYDGFGDDLNDIVEKKEEQFERPALTAEVRERLEGDAIAHGWQRNGSGRWTIRPVPASGNER